MRFYSSVVVGSSGENCDILAENVENGRLFFADEATCKRYPSSIYDALLSDFREAAYMSHYASDRASGFNIKKNKSEKKANARDFVLSDLFKQPDEEFGCYALLYGRKRANLRAVLRVTLKVNQHNSRWQYSDDFLFKKLQYDIKQQHEFHVYRLISKRGALELKEARDDDEARMKFLIDQPRVQLLRCDGLLEKSADSLFASIKAERLENHRSSSSGGQSRPKRKRKKTIGQSKYKRFASN